MGYNEFWLGNKKIFSLVDDTVRPDKVLKDYTFHDADGNAMAGTCLFDTQTNLAKINESTGSNYKPVQSVQMQAGVVGFVNGQKVEGALPNRGIYNLVVNNLSLDNIDEGGEIVVENDPDKQIVEGIRISVQSVDNSGANTLVPENIRAGVNILGIPGSFTGMENYYTGQATVQAKLNSQYYTPSQFQGTNESGDIGVADAISQVLVSGISVKRVSNASNVDGAVGNGYAIHISQGEEFTLPWTD